MSSPSAGSSISTAPPRSLASSCHSANVAAVSDSRVGARGVAISNPRRPPPARAPRRPATGAIHRVPPALHRPSDGEPGIQPAATQAPAATSSNANGSAGSSLRCGPVKSAAAAAPNPGRARKGPGRRSALHSGTHPALHGRDGANEREREKEPRPEASPFVPVVDRRPAPYPGRAGAWSDRPAFCSTRRAAASHA